MRLCASLALELITQMTNYFRCIKLLSYSTKRQIYDEIFCSFWSFQLLDPGLGPSLFGRDLTLGYESGLGFGSLAGGSSSRSGNVVSDFSRCVPVSEWETGWGISGHSGDVGFGSPCLTSPSAGFDYY